MVRVRRGVRRFDKVLIVSDNDDDPQISFERVRKQIEDYFGFAPAAPRMSLDGPPSVMILMIPTNDEVGDLETLCLEAAQSADAMTAAHVEQFAALVGTDKWDSERRSEEMKLRSNLAARCQRDPFVTLQNVFTNQNNHFLVPLNHQSFQDVSNILSSFAR